MRMGAGNDKQTREGWEEGRPPATAPSRFAPPSWPEFEEGALRVHFARNDEDLRAVQRLRYEVFNLELDEGLDESHQHGLDRDHFDSVCDHLMVVDRRTGVLTGTYRLQAWARAQQRLGYYSAGEFCLDELAPSVLERSIELGRACIHQDHRNGNVLFALWRGLAAYASWTGGRFLLGCCSLTSQDPLDGVRMHRHLDAQGYLHPELHVSPQPEIACHALAPPADFEGEPEPVVPKLFATYLRYGALALGPPALDREFGTIDFLVALDLKGLTPRVRDLFFVGLPAARP